MLLSLSREEDAKAKERILLKTIKTVDDLARLYSVLMAMIADGEECEVEVWQEAE